jgi:hypothetical protein
LRFVLLLGFLLALLLGFLFVPLFGFAALLRGGG